MGLSHLSRKMDTKPLTLKTFLGTLLYFNRKDRILGSQAKQLSPPEEEKLGIPHLMTAGNGAVSANVQLL